MLHVRDLFEGPSAMVVPGIIKARSWTVSPSACAQASVGFHGMKGSEA